ncbi:uncharacterized protein LOC125223720 [Salvia hispanica]|uniref:uncharacterized protein LOC125223720 n=1 Tax=Salvia hispanica TaxID=49212 RepID=UPI0020094D41|nr:uncharacterized protein LOC125223720 [Salvia hispanica]
MIDFAAVMIATALFAFLCPGLVLQLPGKNKPVEFLNMKTSVLAIVLHAVIYGLLLVLFLVMLDIHIYA